MGAGARDRGSRIGWQLRKRVGVCLDTAHVFAGGYDLIKDYDGVWQRFDDIIGLELLGLIHLNDSKAPLGSKKDRHELIGEGMIGATPFATGTTTGACDGVTWMTTAGVGALTAAISSKKHRP